GGAGARGLPRGSRRLLHVRRRYRGRLRGPARPDRLQAGGARRDRRVGGDVVGVALDRGSAGRLGGSRLGACSGRRLRVGEGSSLMAVAAREQEVVEVDLAVTSLRDLNQRLHDLAATPAPTHWRVVNPSGAHAVACGLDAEIEVEIEGHVGYYCAGMNKQATVRVHGNASTGIAENMMSGRVEVDGNVSQSAGATGRGGLLAVHGNASS